MRLEDLRPRAAVPFLAAPPEPLDCFGTLPPLPPPPRAPGTWTTPSPRPSPGDADLCVTVTAALGPRRGTAILVPPWKLPRLSLLSGWSTLLARQGYSVWTLVPPRHLQRAPPGERSGEAFATPDLPALRAAVEQLVLEIRLLLALARGEGGEVTLLGLSFGGLASALAVTAPEAPERFAAVAPPADLLAIMAGTRIGRRYRKLASRAGSPVPAWSALEPMLAPFRPGARRLLSPRVMVAVASADGIALPGPAVDLARTWGAELRLYPRGHLTLLFLCHAVREDVGRFLA
jgi:hypothetical protein